MSKVGELFDEVGKSYFENDTKPVTRVYVDLEYIQDLRFGALLYGITVEQEMKYIHNRLDVYNNRYDRKICKYFPVLKKTEEDLNKLLSDPIAKDKICFLAPWTSVFFNLITLIMTYKHHNMRFLDVAPRMTVVINVADVDYPIELRQYIETTLSEQWDINVEVQQLPRYEGELSEYLQYDLLMLYDYGQFVNTFPSAFVGEGKFSDIRIIAQPYIEEGLGHKEDDYEYVLTSTEKGMDIYCDFSFLRSNIVKDRKDE